MPASKKKKKAKKRTDKPWTQVIDEDISSEKGFIGSRFGPRDRAAYNRAKRNAAILSDVIKKTDKALKVLKVQKRRITDMIKRKRKT